jgi:hypothetical protein
LSAVITTDVRLALLLLVKEILIQIDEVACLKSKGHSATISLIMLRETCSILATLEQELLEEYFSLLIRLTTKPSRPRAATFSVDYAENVVEAKKRFNVRIRTELQKVA